jgi:nucleoside-diphosphate-sugar epimerase
VPDLRGTRVLISGAAGFLGANLTRELLRQGAAVHAVVRPGSELCRIANIVPDLSLHTVDLLDADALHRVVTLARPVFVIHLAVRREDRSPSERQATLQANVLGTSNLLESTASLDYRRFVHFGSSLEYGPAAGPLRENTFPRPRTYYGVTKAAATLLCQQAARGGSRPVVVLRPFNVYGPWEAPHRLVPTAIAAALHEGEMALTAPGYRRDWVYVDDVVDACLLALAAEEIAGEVINIGSGRQHGNEDIVGMVEALTGHTIRVRRGEHPPRPWDRPAWVADMAKSKRLLGWEPRHSLREGLARTIAWHQERVAAESPALATLCR